MSVIEEVFQRLETLRTNPSSTVVDMLVKIHDQGLQSLPNSKDALKMISNTLAHKPEHNEDQTKNSSADPFPNFLNEDSATDQHRAAIVPETANRESISQLLEQVLTSYQELLSNYNRDFDAIQARRAKDVEETEDEIIARLRDMQLLLLKYPIAGQALFASLVRQGREYAKTEKGAVLQSQLAQSPVVAKARTLFEGVTGGMLAEQNGELPATYIDGFIEALDRDLETVLSELGGVGSGI